MAQIVAGFGVPHTPVFPFFVKRDGPDCETAKLFAAQKEQLAAARPDVIVMFDTDHLKPETPPRSTTKAAGGSP